MTLIMLTSWTPMGKETEVAEKYLELLKTPLDKSLLKRIVPMGIRITKDGIRNIAIYEVKQGKVEEAVAHLSKRVLVNFSGVEGAKVEMELLSTGAEALPVIGLKMPE